MPRFFIEDLFVEEDLPERITLQGEDAVHLVRALRARAGEEVTVVSGNGRELICRFVESRESGRDLAAILSVERMEERSANSPVRVTLLQGMPKGKKTDLIIQKSTELGVDRIQFVYMDRSVPTWEKGVEKKTERFERIAEEAAKQCGRTSLVKIGLSPSLEEAFSFLTDCDTSFACYEAEQVRSISSLLKQDFSSLAFLIGPEGGISSREANLLEQAGIPTVSLGRRILRTETAPLAVLSMLMYEKELCDPQEH